jgi:hypothetical protein
MLPIPVGAHQPLVSTGYGAMLDMQWGHSSVLADAFGIPFAVQPSLL